MPVNRHGPCPFYIKYITQSVLIPCSAAPLPTLHDYLEADAMWVDIPCYQRGIAWTGSDVEELLESHSILLGNVVLGKFPRPPEGFPNLPSDIHYYSVLVDGLQRFSIGTALLAILFPEVLSATPAKPQVSPYFRRLAIKTKDVDVIFLHNDSELTNHPRRAISEAYGAFRHKLKQGVLDKLGQQTKAEEFSVQLTRLFLERQIAVDLYSDFAKPIELTYTFIGMNTVRVDLTPADLVRSIVVERAISSSWNSDEVAAFENRFTSVFAEEDKPVSHLLPFVAVLKSTLEDDEKAVQLFPSWKIRLKEVEVSRFLDFLEAFEGCVENQHLKEIQACGAIPYAGVLAFFYPSFLASGKLPQLLNEIDVDSVGLSVFLRANLRVLIDGRIGRTRIFVERALGGEYGDLRSYSDAISQTFLGRGIEQRVSEDWLRACLRRADKGKSKRIFNSILLPIARTDGFRPDVYGLKATEYHVDHLIPQRCIESNLAGATESETILNFAPLPAQYNVKAKMTPCAEKLGPQGIYAHWLQNAPAAHPYSQWLVSHQGQMGSYLDQQERLEPNQKPDVAGERLDWIVEHLLPRL